MFKIIKTVDGQTVSKGSLVSYRNMVMRVTSITDWYITLIDVNQIEHAVMLGDDGVVLKKDFAVLR